MKRGANQNDIAKIQKYAAGRPQDNVPGMSAEHISKVLRIDIKTVKAFMDPQAVKEAIAAKQNTNKAREEAEDEKRLDTEAEKAAAAADRIEEKKKAKKAK